MIDDHEQDVPPSPEHQDATVDVPPASDRDEAVTAINKRYRVWMYSLMFPIFFAANIAARSVAAALGHPESDWIIIPAFFVFAGGPLAGMRWWFQRKIRRQ